MTPTVPAGADAHVVSAAVSVGRDEAGRPAAGRAHGADEGGRAHAITARRRRPTGRRARRRPGLRRRCTR